EPSAHRVAPGGGAEHRAGHRAAVVDQLVDGLALAYLGTGPSRSVDEPGVEDAPRKAQPMLAERGAAGPREQPEQLAPERGHHAQPRKWMPALAVELLEHAEPADQPQRLGTHVLGAWLLAREGGTVRHDDAEPGSRQVDRRRAARGTAAGDENVDSRIGHPRNRSYRSPPSSRPSRPSGSHGSRSSSPTSKRSVMVRPFAR